MYDTATNTITTSITSSPAVRTFPIAVNTDVRTLGYAPGEVGSKYALDGSLLSSGYTHNLTESLSDGTTDGTYNYAVSWASGTVYRFTTDWETPTYLFSANLGGSTPGGITYDSSDNTFWFSEDRGGYVWNYSKDGMLLSSFNTGLSIDWNLALNPEDKTLWFGSAFGTSLYQFSKTGTMLGSYSPTGYDAASFYSGEFSVYQSPAVPEPSTLAIFGIGAGIAGLKARKKKRVV
ncbi:MAG: PEP-CTERM sorting domain-containing protein [Planctomycetes bacterium]|nr:PEP-CTERM sorting domain-containing protein [Planctomycetota bacterium]